MWAALSNNTIASNDAQAIYHCTFYYIFFITVVLLNWFWKLHNLMNGSIILCNFRSICYVQTSAFYFETLIVKPNLKVTSFSEGQIPTLTVLPTSPKNKDKRKKKLTPKTTWFPPRARTGGASTPRTRVCPGPSDWSASCDPRGRIPSGPVAPVCPDRGPTTDGASLHHPGPGRWRPRVWIRPGRRDRECRASRGALCWSRSRHRGLPLWGSLWERRRICND